MIRILDLPPAGCPSSPEPDYPAAHSMDTTWYAVDEAGHVAAFQTGLDGVAPVGAKNLYYLEALYDSHRPDAFREPRVPSHTEMADQVGFYLYWYRGAEYNPIDLFERRVVPRHPIHVEQLLPEVRAVCKRTRSPVSFAAAEWIQPLAYLDCFFWEEDGDRLAYLAADGVTIAPIKGREDRFDEFVIGFRATAPDEAARYHFEGMDNGR